MTVGEELHAHLTLQALRRFYFKDLFLYVSAFYIQ